MGVDAEELIIRPFKEVVERGNDAVANAEADDTDPELSERMAKAARAIVREGERALKRLQPIWDGQVEKYGDAFKEAMMQQDDVEKKRRLLEDLLYDFEDYTELDTFEPEKFAELQAATKSFALDVIDITKRLKLDVPKRAETPSGTPPPSAFPPLPPLPPIPPIPRDDRRSFQSVASRPSMKTVHPRAIPAIPGSPEAAAEDGNSSPHSEPNGRDGADHVSHSGQRQSAASSLKRAGTKSSTGSHLDVMSIPEERRPSSPDILGDAGEHVRVPGGMGTLGKPNLVDIPTSMPRTSAWVRNHAAAARARPPVRPRASRDTMNTVATDYSSFDSPLVSRFNSLTMDGSTRSATASIFDSAPSPVLTDSRTSFFSNANSYTSSSVSNPSPMITPAEIPTSDMRGTSLAAHVPPPQLPPVMLPPSALPGSPSIAPSIAASIAPSVAASTLAGTDDGMSMTVEDFIKFAPSPPVPPISLPSAAEPDLDNGLMLVEEEAAAEAADTASNLDMPTTREYCRETDCTIGPKSSYNQMGGFCKGAEAFRAGGHWQGIKQASGYVANKQTMIGRCVGCGYAHNYEEVRIDIDKRPEANFNKVGMRFRLRMLYKSHIANAANSQRQAESHYACLFCVQAGSTVREGDATVFPSPDHLMLHLARHPQPLPPVPGVTVLYGEVAADDPHAEDFDVHFPNPPLPTPVPPTVGKSPVATALREHMQRYGAKKLARPPNFGGDLLPFMSGARIVGVMFPEKWEGKWCMGWHDGVVGAFPAKAAEVEPPRQSEIPMESSSGMSVTARWKWKPRDNHKDKENSKHHQLKDPESGGLASSASSVWLEFDKGETISNVKCLYADHWCWSGTNSKGRFGVFPQSHILLKSLHSEPVAAEAGTGTARSVKKPSRARGLFSRRPTSSSAASSMSSSTGRTTSAFS